MSEKKSKGLHAMDWNFQKVEPAGLFLVNVIDDIRLEMYSKLAIAFWE